MKLKKQIPMILFLFVLFFLFTPKNFAEEESETVAIDANAAFSFDQKTGKVFYAKNPDEKLGIASITKIISAYLVFEQLHQKKLKLTDKVAIGEYPYELTKVEGLSNIPLEKEYKYSVKELLDAGLIASASSCIIALAEKIDGSEAKFVERMNKKLASWGIKNVSLINSTGLNNETIPENYRLPGSAPDQENQMSARDVAIVAYHLLHDFPEILEITKKSTEKFGTGSHSEVELKTYNGMLPGGSWEYAGIDGLKTGTTDFAGKCFVGTCKKRDWRVVTLILHANGESDSRFSETASLLDFVYENWKQRKIVSKGQTFEKAKTIPVIDGKQRKVPIAIDEEVTTWVRSDMNKEKVDVTYHDGKEKRLSAPIDKGEKAGTVEIRLKEDTLGYLLPSQMKKQSYSMVTTKIVEREFFLKVWTDHFLNWVNEKLGE